MTSHVVPSQVKFHTGFTQSERRVMLFWTGLFDPTVAGLVKQREELGLSPRSLCTHSAHGEKAAEDPSSCDKKGRTSIPVDMNERYAQRPNIQGGPFLSHVRVTCSFSAVLFRDPPDCDPQAGLIISDRYGQIQRNAAVCDPGPPSPQACMLRVGQAKSKHSSNSRRTWRGWTIFRILDQDPMISSWKKPKGWEAIDWNNCWDPAKIVSFTIDPSLVCTIWTL